LGATAIPKVLYVLPGKRDFMGDSGLNKVLRKKTAYFTEPSINWYLL
jgi:hypothetical protein